ncbi:MAG: hypothetical protein AAF725_17730 [Acidobacteriota bacterium]
MRRGPRGATSRLGLLIATAAACVLLAALPAAAHPFDADYYSSRAEVVAGQDGPRFTVIVEVPTRRIIENFLELYGDPSSLDEESDRLFRERQFATLASQLRLFLSGRAVAGEWLPVEGESNGRGTETFFIYLLEFHPKDPAIFDASRLNVRLDMEVFPREFIYLSATTDVQSPWVLSGNSAEKILAASSDELFDPETGRWSVDPRLRRLKFLLEKEASEP